MEKIESGENKKELGREATFSCQTPQFVFVFFSLGSQDSSFTRYYLNA